MNIQPPKMSENARYLAFFSDKNQSGSSGPNSESPSIERKTKYNIIPEINPHVAFAGFRNEKLGLRSSSNLTEDDGRVSDAEPDSLSRLLAFSTPRDSKEDLSKLMPIYLDISKVTSAPSNPKNFRTLKHTLSRRYDVTGYVTDRTKKAETEKTDSANENSVNSASTNKTPYSPSGYIEEKDQLSNLSDSESESSSDEENVPSFGTKF